MKNKILKLFSFSLLSLMTVTGCASGEDSSVPARPLDMEIGMQGEYQVTPLKDLYKMMHDDYLKNQAAKSQSTDGLYCFEGIVTRVNDGSFYLANGSNDDGYTGILVNSPALISKDIIQVNKKLKIKARLSIEGGIFQTVERTAVLLEDQGSVQSEIPELSLINSSTLVDTNQNLMISTKDTPLEFVSTNLDSVSPSETYNINCSIKDARGSKSTTVYIRVREDLNDNLRQTISFLISSINQKTSTTKGDMLEVSKACLTYKLIKEVKGTKVTYKDEYYLDLFDNSSVTCPDKQ